MNSKLTERVLQRIRRIPGWTIPAVAVLLVALTALGLVRRGSTREGFDGALATVRRGPLTISLVENGNIRPRQQIILKNEMDDPATILFIVKEGTHVKKGDLLVELDASLQETERVERAIRVENDRADLVYAQENYKVVTNQAQADIDQARLLHDFAKQDLDKYLKGEYPKQLMGLEAQITIAEEELSRAQEELRWSEVLFREKYLSQADLQQDQLVMRKAQLNLDLAREDLTLFKEYTHLRTLAELKSNVRQTEMALERTERRAAASIAQADAQLRAREAAFEEGKARLQRIEREIALAKIHAPIDGMVIYASSVSGDWDDDEDLIQEGATVDERGEIIYLPTADAFDVDFSIPEISLNVVHPGQLVRVHVDALSGKSLTGRITRIARLPNSRSRWLNPNLKVYDGVVQLDPSDLPLRNGMSCKVEIIIEELADATYVPIQCVVQRDRTPVVYVLRDGVPESVPVELGLDNRRFIYIRSGLEAGQQVLLTPPLDEPGADGATSRDNLQQPSAPDTEEPKEESPQENPPETPDDEPPVDPGKLTTSFSPLSQANQTGQTGQTGRTRRTRQTRLILS